MIQLFIKISILIHLFAEPVNFQTIFGDKYSNAIQFITTNKEKFNKLCKKYQIDDRTLISVVFPERIRYSIFSDYFETKALCIAYQDLGSSYVDFSIGHFQMKPSFIEKLDSSICSDSLLSKKYLVLKYAQTNENEIRKVRIQRLQNLNFQIIYTCAFIEISQKKFKITNLNKAEQIRFLASAYNHGFDSSAEEIRRFSNKAFFPYGSSFPGKQYIYADISLDFYLNQYEKYF